ncbi:transposase [Streptomyces coeruleorubidus]|uniref:transposase n=1 Tax=Streptomyces coeruleorubidus TaxID=116188 RepID=UPI0036F7CD5E
MPPRGYVRRLNHGQIDADRLRPLLAGLPHPRFPEGRLVRAVDVSPWPRSDAPCSLSSSLAS